MPIAACSTLTGLQWGIYDAYKVYVGLPTTGSAPPPTAEDAADKVEVRTVSRRKSACTCGNVSAASIAVADHLKVQPQSSLIRFERSASLTTMRCKAVAHAAATICAHVWTLQCDECRTRWMRRRASCRRRRRKQSPRLVRSLALLTDHCTAHCPLRKVQHVLSGALVSRSLGLRREGSGADLRVVTCSGM